MATRSCCCSAWHTGPPLLLVLLPLLLQVVIPKPGAAGPASDPPGVGLVFLEYEDARSAEKARVALNGRSFEDRSVVATLVQSVGEVAA